MSVAEGNGGEVRYVGEFSNTPEAMVKLVKQLRKANARLSFGYEAGPCGYGIHRQLTDLGWDCMVVAPSLIPKKSGDRVKTDRRDSMSLARLLRAGELTAVWVPDDAQEALRDLTWAREDMKHLEKQAKQRLLAFLLRYGRSFAGKSNKSRGGITKTGNGHVRRVFTCLMFAALIKHWTWPLRSCDALYDEAFRCALDSGDFVNVGVVVAVRATDRLILGDYLPDLLQAIERDLVLMRANGQTDLADCTIAAALQPIKRYRGHRHPDRRARQSAGSTAIQWPAVGSRVRGTRRLPGQPGH